MPFRLSIFKKLFFAYLLVGIVAVLCSAVSHYDLSRSWVEKDMKGQVANSFAKAITYFEEFYTQAISNDLTLITLTSLLDNFLVSENQGISLAQPKAETLFLHFSKNMGTKYLSVRFIDAQGKEKIIAQGDRRASRYASVDNPPAGEFYSRVFSLFRRLEKMPSGELLFDGPFQMDGKWTFLTGVAKRDSAGMGFGGVVIFHCDLTPYFRYLSTIRFRGHSISSILSNDRKILIFPENQSAGSGEIINSSLLNQGAWHTFSHGMTFGKGGGQMFTLIMRIPRVLFMKELQITLTHSVWIGVLIMLIVAFTAFFVSHNITRPIKRLVRTTKRVANGDLSVRAEEVSGDEIGQLTNSFNEMIVSLRKSEERLQYEAFHDVLTALPNRSLLLDRLERLIERNRRHPEHRFAVLFIDLDRFKNVNDSLGHPRGDELLIAISHRLRKCLRSMDTVARLGGDEFIILMDEIHDVKEATELAERILKDLEPLFLIAGQEIYVSASIGIVMSHSRYARPSDYLRDTDIAMYRAKESGKARYQVFDSSMQKNSVPSLQLESELRNAIDRGEFILHYQPIVSLTTREIVCLEALVRWQHPHKGLIYPTDFISLAEESGLILGIGRMVLEKVCVQIRTWREQGLRVVPIAVNFSAKQLEQKDLLEMMEVILNRNNVPGNFLAAEITESVAVRDVSRSITLLNQFRDLGIKIAIDDFGVGYSSLNSLKLFPIDELKIDRSFIYDIVENPDKAAIAKAIVVMAHSLGYTVTGEGIENQEQMDFLVRNGCDYGQGFYFSPAVSEKEIRNKLT